MHVAKFAYFFWCRLALMYPILFTLQWATEEQRGPRWPACNAGVGC